MPPDRSTSSRESPNAGSVQPSDPQGLLAAVRAAAGGSYDILGTVSGASGDPLFLAREIATDRPVALPASRELAQGGDGILLPGISLIPDGADGELADVSPIGAHPDASGAAPKTPAPTALLAAIRATIGESYEVVGDLGAAGGGSRLYLVRERASGALQVFRLRRDPKAEPGEPAFVLHETEVLSAIRSHTPIHADAAPTEPLRAQLEPLPPPPPDTAPASKICPECGIRYAADLAFCPRDGTTLQSARDPGAMIGRVVAGRFRVLEKVGAGGMGEVYQAEQLSVGRPVALKILNRTLAGDPEALRRFRREARNASLLSNTHVAAVYDYGESDDGVVYLAMEYVSGPTLARLLAGGKPLPPLRAAGIVEQVADALTAAHAQRPPLIHCDLKPDNIMLAPQIDESDCVKVVDFGIAKAPGGDRQVVTRPGMVAGTPAYMSPEQLAAAEPDAPSDVYSLGLVAFEMLTGARPFVGDESYAGACQRWTVPPRQLVDVRSDVAWPARLQVTMDRVLAREPEARYRTARAFARDFSDAIAAWPVASGSQPSLGAAAPDRPGLAQVAEPETPDVRGRPVAEGRVGDRQVARWALGGLAVLVVASAAWYGATRLSDGDKVRGAPVQSGAPSAASGIADTGRSGDQTRVAGTDGSTSGTPSGETTVSGDVGRVQDPPDSATAKHDQVATPGDRRTHASDSAKHVPRGVSAAGKLAREGSPDGTLDAHSKLAQINEWAQGPTATAVTAQQVIEMVPSLLPRLSNARDSVEAEYDEARAYLEIDPPNPAAACRALVRIGGRSVGTEYEHGVAMLVDSIGLNCP